MPKSADAFRTISEVADWLETPAHVLRFWESKFSQVKPVKRAGGRRYYRPADMLLLGGIKKLLHDDGMTIKGVQKVLREQGVKHVSAMSHPLDEDIAPEDSGITLDAEPAPTSATVVDFKSSSGAKTAPVPETTEEAPESATIETGEDTSVEEESTQTTGAPPHEAPDTLAAESDDSLPGGAAETIPLAPSQAPDTLAGGAPDGVEDTVREALSGASDTEAPETGGPFIGDVSASSPPVMPSFRPHRTDAGDSTPQEAPGPESTVSETDKTGTPPAPARIEVPEDPEDDIAAAPGLLSQLSAHDGPIDPAMAKELAPLIERLRGLYGGARPAG